MSVLGINPTRDKWAKAITYGGGFAYFYLIKALGVAATAATGGNVGGIYKMWIDKAKERKDIKDKAWKRYCESGDIWKSLEPFINNNC